MADLQIGTLTIDGIPYECTSASITLKPSLDVEYLTQIVNRSTPSRQRAEAMGFVFLEMRVDNDPHAGIAMQGYFKCVCGRIEQFRFLRQFDVLMNIRPQALEEALAYLFDPVLELEKFGSFSREHLLADGYAPDVVDKILEKGEDFDARRRGIPESELPSVLRRRYARG